jgi:hypothetical protein
VIHRHLEYPENTAAEDLSRAALDDMLDRGDLETWKPVARAIAADPWGALATKVLALCEAHPMYGTSALWRSWIERRRAAGAPTGLAELRRRAGMSQAQVAARLGLSQPDISKLERRADVRVSTLRAYVEALGAGLHVTATLPDGTTIDIA